MADHSAPLDPAICDRVAPGLHGQLASLGVELVLDRPAYRAAGGYDPVVAPVFLVGPNPGGSYDGPDAQGRELRVLNGSPIYGAGRRFAAVSARYEAGWRGVPSEAEPDAWWTISVARPEGARARC